MPGNQWISERYHSSFKNLPVTGRLEVIFLLRVQCRSINFLKCFQLKKHNLQLVQPRIEKNSRASSCELVCFPIPGRSLATDLALSSLGLPVTRQDMISLSRTLTHEKYPRSPIFARIDSYFVPGSVIPPRRLCLVPLTDRWSASDPSSYRRASEGRPLRRRGVPVYLPALQTTGTAASVSPRPWPLSLCLCVQLSTRSKGGSHRGLLAGDPHGNAS